MSDFIIRSQICQCASSIISPSASSKLNGTEHFGTASNRQQVSELLRVVSIDCMSRRVGLKTSSHMCPLEQRWYHTNSLTRIKARG